MKTGLKTLLFLGFWILKLNLSGQIQSITLQTSASRCDQPTGAVWVSNVTGGVSPFQYSLNGQSFTSDSLFNQLPVGDSVIFISDNAGQVFSQTFSIDSLSNPKIDLEVIDQECEFKPGTISILGIANAPSPYVVYIDSTETTETYFERAAGFYTIWVEDDNGCIGIKEADIDNDCIVISQGFSPNGDGINDTWNIDKLARYQNAVIKVFSRNGMLVFNSKGYDEEWDGRSAGLPLPTGTYYYLVKIDETNPQADVFTGYVAIVK